jgi:hypothetical protein
MDMVGKNQCVLFIPVQVRVHGWPLANGDHWAGSSDRSAWTSFVFGQQVCHRVPDPAQCEATVPVEVFIVHPYLDCLLDEAFHVPWCAVQHRDDVEVSLVPCVDTGFRHRRFLRLIETCLTCSLYLASIDPPVWPMYTFPHSQGLRYTPGLSNLTYPWQFIILSHRESNRSYSQYFVYICQAFLTLQLFVWFQWDTY